MTPVRTLEADKGATVKTLWSLHDGVKVESVLMKYPERATLCVTSQAGCGMACPFCATGQMGLTRNLSAAEIIEQVRLAARASRDGVLGGDPVRLSNVVFMGMGEPLANYKAVMAAVRALVAPAPLGFGLSARHVTVSTVGLVPAHRQARGGGNPGHARACRCTPLTTSCATSSCRSTLASASTRLSTRPSAIST